MSEQKIHFYKGPAGGWGALRSVAKHLQEQGIAVKGAKTLLSANQPDGFDCPGCAWPDRDHRSTFEFCENGAKAISAEATAKRATPEVLSAPHGELAGRAVRLRPGKHGPHHRAHDVRPGE